MSDKHEYAQLLVEQPDFCDVLERKRTMSNVQPGKKNLDMRRVWSFLLVAILCLVFFATGVLFGTKIQEKGNPFLLTFLHTNDAPSYNKHEVLNGAETEGTQCGSSWEEAKAMGCKFDVVGSRWYAPECFFQEVLDEMLAEPWMNFTWYADEGHTEVFPSEKAKAGEFVHVYPDRCKSYPTREGI